MDIAMVSAPPGSADSSTRTPQPRGLRRWVPGISLLRSYQRAWLTRDLCAGLVLTAILVPVGMGYSEASGIPAIYGLYATIVPLIVYAVFGRSRTLVLGPDSALAAVIAATILPMAGGSVERAVAYAGMLAILSGTLCMLAGLARFGFVTDLLSKPIRYGFLNGIALTVLVGQLPKVFGFSVHGEELIQEATGLAQGILGRQTNWTVFSIGTVCLIVITAGQRWLPRIPGVLIAVVGAMIAVALFDLDLKAGVPVVGRLPEGLPAFRIPAVSPNEIRSLLAGATAIALISFTDMSVMSRMFAMRGGYKVDANQELVALGIANVVSGFFQGFCISSSASRTAVAESAGARSQVTCLTGAVCVAVLLIVAPTLMQTLPAAALAAVVISACLSLVEIRSVWRLYHVRRIEFILSIVCFLGVALIGVIQGIFIAVGLALFFFIWRAWRPYDAVLGRVDGLKGYHDITRHPEARLIPGLVLFRWDAPLFFANAGIFREHVMQAVADSPTPVKWIVVAAEPVTDIDTTAADALAELDADLHQAGIELCFAEMKGPVKDHLKRYGLFAGLGMDNFFPTIGQAVDRYVEVNRVEWQDWDEVKS